jgi:hypothetical protein
MGRGECVPRTFENSGAITTHTIAGAALPLVIATGNAAQSHLAGLGPHIVAAVPGSELLVYEHLGHFGPFQDLYRVAADILELTSAASSD